MAAAAAHSKWLRVAAVVLLAAIAAATFVPVGWQLRTGLHWLVEHFLAYFTVTALFCLAWPGRWRWRRCLFPSPFCWS